MFAELRLYLLLINMILTKKKNQDKNAIDLIGVLKTVMHYGFESGIEQRKVSWEIKRSISTDKRFVSIERPE